MYWWKLWLNVLEGRGNWRVAGGGVETRGL